MNYRKAILRELYKFYEDKGPNNFAVAHTLKAFSPGNKKFLTAVNQLLEERLINGSKVPLYVDPDGVLAIAINPVSLVDIKRELRSWYRDPKFLIGTMIAAIGLIIALLELLKLL